LNSSYSPFKEIRGIEERLFGSRSAEETQENPAAFTPKVNTREGASAYYVEADLPGVKKEDIRVDIRENVLTVSGERRLKAEVHAKEYFRVESSFGIFSRSFTLPDNVDTEKIEVVSENGVLEVVIPKRAEKETA